jgi:hypothetical protein
MPEIMLSNLLEKGVGLTFLSDAGGGAVPRIDGCVRRQNQEFVPDGSHQRIIVSARQIGPPDTLLEQRITGDHKAAFFRIKGQASR